MRAGDLQHSILLKRKVATTDKGKEVVSYIPVGKPISAKAEPIDGRQYEALQQAQSEIDIRFTIYYRADVQSDWRVEWRGRDYEIVGPPIDVNAEQVWLRLMCKTSQSA